MLSQLPTTPYWHPVSVLHSCLRINPCPPFACHSQPRPSTLSAYTFLSLAPSSLHHGQSQESTTGILPNVVPSRSRHRIRFSGHCLRHPDLVLLKVKRRWIQTALDIPHRKYPHSRLLIFDWKSILTMVQLDRSSQPHFSRSSPSSSPHFSIAAHSSHRYST